MNSDGNMNLSVPGPIERGPVGASVLTAPRAAEAYSVPPIIVQYWQMTLRWKKPALAILVTCLALGFIATLLMPLKYTASTQLEINREQKQVTSVQGLESPDAGQDQEFYDTQYALLEARSLAERVSRRLNLARSDEFFTSQGVKLDADEYGNDTKARLTPAQRQKRERLATRLLLDHVDVAPVRKSRLVAIAYTSRSPELSARIANTWAQQFIAETMDRQFASTADARKFLEDRLGALRTKLEQSERDLVNYASHNEIVPLTVQRDAAGKTTSERTLAASNVEALSQALNGAVADRIAAESRLVGNGQNNPEVLASQTVGVLRQKRAELAAEYANMMVQFNADYPPARALNEEIASLDTAIARETGRFSNGRQQSYREALTRERDVRSQLGQQMAKLDTQQRASIQYNIYQREVDTNRQLYDALLQRYKEIGVAGLVGANNISIIDQADVPQNPSSPSLFKNLFVALVLGLALAAGTALALDHIDEGIRIPADVTRQLDLPLLGYVPDQEEDPLDVIRDVKSAFIESYFSIRSNLAFTTAHGLPRSMMVTSTRPSEGKSMTSLALAVVIGVTGKRVLLIDADMRSPSVHEYTGGDNARGLSNLLAGDSDYRSVIAPTAFKGVSILPAGPHPPSAAELLSNDRLRRISLELLKDFDHIIFDSPPVLGLTDAPILGGAVEGCIYVIESEGVPVRAIREAISRLQQVNAHILGVVLTKLATSAAGYGYGYGYGYEYGSDKSDAGAPAS